MENDQSELNGGSDSVQRPVRRFWPYCFAQVMALGPIAFYNFNGVPIWLRMILLAVQLYGIAWMCRIIYKTSEAEREWLKQAEARHVERRKKAAEDILSNEKGHQSQPGASVTTKKDSE